MSPYPPTGKKLICKNQKIVDIHDGAIICRLAGMILFKASSTASHADRNLLFSWPERRWKNMSPYPPTGKKLICKNQKIVDIYDGAIICRLAGMILFEASSTASHSDRHLLFSWPERRWKPFPLSAYTGKILLCKNEDGGNNQYYDYFPVLLRFRNILESSADQNEGEKTFPLCLIMQALKYVWWTHMMGLSADWN